MQQYRKRMKGKCERKDKRKYRNVLSKIMYISGSNSIREAQRVKTRKQSLKILALLIKLYLPQTTHLLCENYSVDPAVTHRWTGLFSRLKSWSSMADSNFLWANRLILIPVAFFIVKARDKKEWKSTLTRCLLALLLVELALDKSNCSHLETTKDATYMQHKQFFDLS